MRMRRCLSRNIDEGCFSSTALAASADSSLYATGSKAGVVNLYRYPQRLAASLSMQCVVYIECLHASQSACPERALRMGNYITLPMDKRHISRKVRFCRGIMLSVEHGANCAGIKAFMWRLAGLYCPQLPLQSKRS